MSTYSVGDFVVVTEDCGYRNGDDHPVKGIITHVFEQDDWEGNTYYEYRIELEEPWVDSYDEEEFNDLVVAEIDIEKVITRPKRPKRKSGFGTFVLEKGI